MRLARRCVPAFGLLACALLLSGCVYLRLLRLKWQLAEFDRNFAVQTADGLALTFKQPVLLDEDVESFFRWIPDTRQRSGDAEQWRFRWIKQPAAEDGEAVVEFAVELMFVDHRLVRLSAPETFFAATMPKSLALAALRSLGSAQIDRKNRRAESTLSSTDLEMAAAEAFLTAQGVTAALGAPGMRRETGGLLEWRYEFRPASAQQRVGNSGAVDITFLIDPSTQRVRVMKGQTVFGTVVFDTTRVGAGATGSVQAGQRD